jgi:two-component system, OmpR family, sensor histidine kinase BaeS
MRFSMTSRLAALFAFLLMGGILVTTLIFHRLSDVEFEIASDEKISDHAQSLAESVKHELEGAWRRNGWIAVRASLDSWRERRDATRWLVFDASFAVVGSSLDHLQAAKVTPLANGEHVVCFSGGAGGQQVESELAFARSPTISGTDGTVIGYFFPVPDVKRGEAGRAFANQVWLRSAPWLAAILSLSVVVIVALVRRELRPLAIVTRAIEQLDRGEFPDPVSVEASREFALLVTAVNKASETLKRAERMRRNLVSDIAHELRTPLTNLAGQLDTATAGLVPVDQALVRNLAAELKLLVRLVEDFQHLALSDSGQLKIVMQDLPANETIRNIVEVLAARSGALLTVDIPGPVTIRADEDRLRQVLANLMDNAGRHGPQGLKVTIRLESTDPGIVLSFSDNGPGIAREDQSQVFERYYRTNSLNGRSAQGSGLGLAIVRSLMRAMGGEIEYLERQETGASFRLTFQGNRG